MLGQIPRLEEWYSLIITLVGRNSRAEKEQVEELCKKT
jgi:hypothetical protein